MTGHRWSDIGKILLLIECLVLLAPAFIAISILTFGAIVIVPAYFLGTAFGLSQNLPPQALLMPIWLLPLCIASWIALWEVVMAASATLGGRIYSVDNRTKIAVALGMAAILGAWVSTFLDQTDRSAFWHFDFIQHGPGLWGTCAVIGRSHLLVATPPISRTSNVLKARRRTIVDA